MFKRRSSKPVLIDLFCGAGGASMGYAQAGFDVVGVDIVSQPHYPFTFIQADALTIDLSGFDAIHASPPCQAYSQAQRIRRRVHPDLIARIRKRLIESDLPHCIENVPGSPLFHPIELCGIMFGLRQYRHRWFELSMSVLPPPHPPHLCKQAKMGRPARPGEFIQVVGNFSGVAAARAAMQIGWMTRNELREAIPPAYTRWVGQHLMEAVRG